MKKKQFSLSVIGLGRVGLPLASVYANLGIKVVGIDNNSDRLDLIQSSKCPFYDPKLQESLEQALRSGNLVLSENIEDYKNDIDVVIVTVGTPTVENNIDYSQVYSALRELDSLDLKGKMIIFRSTVPPKTTTDIIIPYLEHHSSLKCGYDFGVAMCPERILEGKAIEELHELPEIIGGFNELCNNIAKEIFLIINPEKEILFTTPSGAELAKLFANIYRYTNFALANEFAIWAEEYNVDATKLIKIVNHKYPRSNIPVPGFVGGPCLSKDGTFLTNNTTFSSIISSVWKVNESIPQHIINNIKKISGNLYNKKISILGISFKAGSDDVRNSPSVKLEEIIRSTGANVIVHDPHVKDTSTLEQALEKPDIVIIATNHKEFHNIIPQINQSGAELVYDVWSMFNEQDFKMKYVKFGAGF